MTMAISASVVTVTTEPTPLNPVDSHRNDVGASVLVKNPSSSVTVYVGPADVTADTGYPVGPGEALAVDLAEISAPQGATDEGLYGIVASGTQAVNVLATGV